MLSSDLDASYLPEQVKVLLTNGQQGIKHYLAMLESLAHRHQAAMKDGMPKQLQAFETRIDNCERDLKNAERKMNQLISVLELPASARRSPRSSRRSVSVEYPPVGVVEQQKQSPPLQQSTFAEGRGKLTQRNQRHE